MDSSQNQHQEYMFRAIELAKQGTGEVSPNPLMGAVIVKDNKIIGEGYYPHQGAKYAETFAIEAAGLEAENAELYLNIEPRKQNVNNNSVARIIDSKLSKVFIASPDPNPRISGEGIRFLKEAGIEVEVGLCEKEAKKINEFYFKYSTTRMPFVTMTSFMSLDGKIATYLRDSENISTPKSKEFVHRLRAQYDAVMIGSNTILQDNPQLICKLPGGRNPWKIIVDSQAKTPLNSKLFFQSELSSSRKQILIATTNQVSEERIMALQQAGAEVIKCPENTNHTLTPQVNLKELMYILGKRGISSVLLEGGGTLNASAIQNGIVDKINYIIAPKLVGGQDARTPLEGAGIALMSEAIPVRDWTFQPLGSDMLIEGYIHPDN